MKTTTSRKPAIQPDCHISFAGETYAGAAKWLAKHGRSPEGTKLAESAA
jgi:hypothetical protein